MTARRARGFTLLETVLALTMLAVMLGLLLGGLRAGVRAWDAGTGRGDRADEILLADSFLRKELTAAFPWRFKDPMALRFAFRGDRDSVRFVSMRPAEIGGGGLAFVSFTFEPPRADARGRIVMRRAPADPDAQDFSSLDSAEPFVLIDDVSRARFTYFGAENDVTSLAWGDHWEYPQRMPMHVRLEFAVGETALPDMVAELRLGEEAGCFESGFQRSCQPRR